MVGQAQEAGIPFDYVLFDTWFSGLPQLTTLKKTNADVTVMIKKNSIKYTWTDTDSSECQKPNVNEIYSRNKKRRGWSKYLLSVSVTITLTDSEGNSIPTKLVYARNRRDWIHFVCTDMDPDGETVLRVYTMRWSMETYFKISKSYLKLRMECHSTSYEVLTSHMAVVAIWYMIFAVEQFRNMDNRSLKELFYGIRRDIII